MEPARHPPALDPDLVPEPGAQQASTGGEEGWRGKLRTVLPWVYSFMGHLGVFVLAVCVVGVVVARRPEPPPPLPVDIASEGSAFDGRMVPPGPLVPNVGREGGMEVPMPSPTPPEPTMDKVAVSPRERGMTPVQVPHQIIRGTQGSSSTGNIWDVPSDNGPSGPPSGPGPKAACRKIVFLVDASGSLVDTMPFVVQDLGRMLDGGLNERCSFNIVFFSGRQMNAALGARDGVAVLFPGGPVKATAAHCVKAIDWIGRIEAGGSGDALAALNRALEMDPDQIHVLSDNITGAGRWEMHQDRFMAAFGQAYAKAVARRQGVPIAFKTYQFVYPDAMEKIGRRPTLLRLVEATGGQVAADYHFVSARRLGLR